MKIKYVTMTGADSQTSINGLLDLSAEFKFVEWGILFHKVRQGGPRYPPWNWVDRLCLFTHLHLSAHLCGGWVDDAMRGNLSIFLRHQNVDKAFGTVQLNCYQERLQQALVCGPLWQSISVINNCHKPVVLGGNYANISIDAGQFLNAGVYPLFDASGGHGQSPKVWPAPFATEYGTPLFCGYAGGLGPENIEKELLQIEEAVGEALIWIDMETKLRNPKDEFDLKKCRRVLLAVQRWRSRNQEYD